MDYKLLAALAAIIETQSFDLAAEQLFISQSAISQRIKLLEENILSRIHYPRKIVIINAKDFTSLGKV